MKICSLYGAGYYYIPGTDTCLKIGGYMRASMNFNANNSFAVAFSDHSARSYNFENSRVRWFASMDARSQTEYGTLRSYWRLGMQASNNGGGGLSDYSNRAFVQWAGFTAGLANSFFGFFSFAPYSSQTNVLTGDVGGGGTIVFAYTAQFGNGLSASIAAEDTSVRRVDIFGAGSTYAGRQWPDVVGNVRIDQAWGSAQVMAAAHQVRGLTYGDEVGWAAGAGLKVNLPWAKGDNISVQAAYAKGAVDYANAGMPVSSAVSNNGTTFGYTNTYDAVGTGTGLELTSSWSVGAAAIHHWNSMWDTSLYGGYGEVDYNSAATAILAPAGGDPDWAFWQVGSRTRWTPVKNLRLSVDVIYNQVDTATAQAGANVTATAGDVGWLAGIFRVERYFVP